MCVLLGCNWPGPGGSSGLWPGPTKKMKQGKKGVREKIERKSRGRKLARKRGQGKTGANGVEGKKEARRVES